jgi:uncharacterized protein (DUF2236 family)
VAATTTGSSLTEAGPARADGLFGPASVSWRVMPEPVMWIAGFRALYLQMLHPRVMRGTWQNTALADPRQAWGRFVRTTEFVRIRTYGSLAEVERVARRVRKLHASLRGTDEDGTTFRLDEPELLGWVHCTEIGSYADVARRAGLGLTSEELDAFVDEQRRSAAVVGLDPATVPGSMAELEEYFAAMRPRLRLTPEALRAVVRMFNPSIPMPYAPLKAVTPWFTALAFATLPRWARRLFRMPGSPLTDLAATAALRALRLGTSRVPPHLLFLPAATAAKAQVRALRQALAAGDVPGGDVPGAGVAGRDVPGAGVPGGDVPGGGAGDGEPRGFPGVAPS